jgi:pimeloyl-ACP methyl ester carboxylesterase
MAFFHNDKVSLHYLVRGRGEPLVLIHGLGCSGADWAFQVAALEMRFRVIVPDLPGCGHSPPPRGEYTIDGIAGALWSLLDHLQVSRPNIIGFSLGGAVALEMAALRPDSVPRLGLINSLATYRPNHWRKWLETHVSANVVRLLGMRRAAWLLAARLFPEPWQRAMREHTIAAVGAVPASSYLGMGLALARWAVVDRLDRLTSRILLIAAEYDFTPLEEKRELAAKLHADIVVVRGSRHGTPFDSVEATNASLLALLTDRPLPPKARWVRDTPGRAQALSLTGSIAEEHAMVAAHTATSGFAAASAHAGASGNTKAVGRAMTTRTSLAASVGPG